MQAVRGTVFQADDAVIAILGAEFRGRTPQARDQCVVDLLDREARVVSQQKGAIDGGAGREAIARIGGHGCRDGPVATAGAIGAGGSAELSGAQVGVGPANGLESGRIDLVAVAGHADQHAE